LDFQSLGLTSVDLSKPGLNFQGSNGYWVDSVLVQPTDTKAATRISQHLMKPQSNGCNAWLNIVKPAVHTQEEDL